MEKPVKKREYLERTLEFHRIYNSEIKPIFESYEVFRKKELLAHWFYITGAVVLSTALLWSFPIIILLEDKFGYSESIVKLVLGLGCLLMIVGLVMACHIGKHAKNFALTIKTDCLPRLLKVFSDIKWKNGENIINNYELMKSGLFADFNERVTDDEFTGSHKGVAFKICETYMLHISGSGKSRRAIQIFKGVIISFKSNKTIKNRTMVATKGDLTMKNNYLIYFMFLLYPAMNLIDNYKDPVTWGLLIFLLVVVCLLYKNRMSEEEKLETVNLEDPRFASKFDVSSSDQVEARYLITPAFMERFQQIKTAFGAKKAKCSFYGDQIMFAISTSKNLFEIGSLYKSLNNPKSVTEFYDELSSILKLVEYFKLDEKTGL